MPRTMKQKLESYNAAAVEMALIEEELIRYHKVHDSVKGSMPEHPYVLQTIPISGIDLSVAGMMEARKDKLAALRLEVERFLASVDDPYIASLLRLRYVKGLSWQAVAMRVGGGNSEESVKQTASRFLRKR